jgi:flagellar biosynthetic protein FlhB
MINRLAARVRIPIVESPALARARYAYYETGRELGENHYQAVAELYLKLGVVPTDAPKDQR